MARLITVGITSIFLEHYDIHFHYRIFGIAYPANSGGNWTTFKTLFIYLMLPFIWMLTGLLMMSLLKNSRHIQWRQRLFLTWMAFILVMQFPAGLVAGIFIFDEIGFALFTLFQNIFLRAVAALFVMGMMIYYRPSWLWLFLKTAYSRRFLQEIPEKRSFLRQAFIFPWFIGMILLVIPSFYFGYYFVAITLPAMGLVVTPLFNRVIPAKSPRIVKPRHLRDQDSFLAG